MPQKTSAATLSAAVGTSPELTGTVELEAQRLLDQGRNVILYGPPGTGKTFAALAIQSCWLSANGPGSVLLTTFHPSVGYEDFVQGWRPEPEAEGGFSLRSGVLLQSIEQAADVAKAKKGGRVLLVIDEINRGDVARIFGELITYIEKDKRNVPFTTSQDPTQTLSIPSNLYFLGTMNTADKSISLLDVALRRRFSFIGCYPDPDVFASSTVWLPEVGGVNLATLLVGLNDRLESQGVDRDRQIGHALLAVAASTPDPQQALLDRLQYDVLPLVEEYLYGDPTAVEAVLPGLSGEVRVKGAVSDSDFHSIMNQLMPTVPSPAPT